MSQETKQAAEQAREMTEYAEHNLDDAARHAQKTGDQNLVRRITKVHQEVKEINQDLDKKLDPKNR